MSRRASLARAWVRPACLAAALAWLPIAAGADTGPRPATIAPDAAFTAPLASSPSSGPSLSGGCDVDPYEPNSTCNAPDPPVVAPGVYPGLQLPNFFSTFESDWYRVFVANGQKLSVDLSFVHATGDIQMALYSPDCNFLVNSVTTNNAEHCEFVNTGPGAEYRIVVENYGPSCNSYEMRITATCTDGFDGSCGAALLVGPGSTPNLWATSGFIDWYRVHVRRGERLIATSTYLIAPTQAEIGILSNDCSMLLAYESSPGNLAHSVSYVNDGPDIDFKVGLDPYGSPTCHAYDLTIAIEGTGNIDATVTYGGWTAPIVAKHTLMSTTVPTYLLGNTDSYLMWTSGQTGPYALDEYHAHVFIDEVFSAFSIFHEPVLPGDYFIGDVGPYPIRGGWHTLRHEADFFGSIIETNEFDNSQYAQYLWSPLITTFETPVFRELAPPYPLGYIYLNSDAFQYSRNPSYAAVMSIAPVSPFVDFDLYAYDDYFNSFAGLTNRLAYSIAPTNHTDYVVSHYSGTPNTLFPAAILYYGNPEDFFLVDQSDARFRNGNPMSAPVNWMNQVLGTSRLTDVYEAFMVAGTTVQFSLMRSSGESDLAFSIHPGTAGTVQGGYDGAQSIAINPNLDILTYTASVNGWHPIVVRRDTGGNTNPVTYSFQWAQTTVDAGQEPAAVHQLAFLGASPNPMPEAGRFEFVLPRAGDVTIFLHDAQGRRLSEVRSTGLQAGRQTIAWDGRTAEGAKLAAGVYWATLEFEGQKLTKRIVRL